MRTLMIRSALLSLCVNVHVSMCARMYIRCVCICVVYVCAHVQAANIPLFEIDEVVRLSWNLVLIAIPDEHNPAHVHACSMWMTSISH